VRASFGWQALGGVVSDEDGPVERETWPTLSAVAAKRRRPM
jgi:hypothetical protein